MSDYSQESIEEHRHHQGKLEVQSLYHVKNKHDLSVAYTPGVAAPCLEIKEHEELAHDLTLKGRTVAVVTDGSAVLGLGNIGAKAALPVMEGKCVLFKEFANVDAFPICIESQNVDDIINIVKNISPTFGGINLEDISAPRCFEIEKRLSDDLDIPIFHDDQHGTAIVVCAALINAYRFLNKDLNTANIVINGSGAAGVALAKLLKKIGVDKIIICDSKGVISKKRADIADNKHQSKYLLLEGIGDYSNNAKTLADALKNTDVFIGVSVGNVVDYEMVQSMNDDCVIFALSNPTPEIMPDIALSAGAKIVGTGRSDFANQINNVLVFPGVFKGALKAKVSFITEEMKVAAAYAIANIIPPNLLSDKYIIPDPFEKGIADKVANAIIECVKSNSINE